jgi:DNA-binding transcriptional ArsR family regulator
MPGAAEGPTTGQDPDEAGGESRPSWTILTNHGHVLLAVARDPDMLVEDIAKRVGITRRATLHILKDLEEAGYIERVKEGRRTHYLVEGNRPFRHPAEADHDVGALLKIFAGEEIRGRRPDR